MTPQQEALLGEALAHAYALREAVAMMLANFIPGEHLEKLAAAADKSAEEIGPSVNKGMDHGIQVRVASLYREAIKLGRTVDEIHALEAWTPDASRN